MKKEPEKLEKLEKGKKHQHVLGGVCVSILIRGHFDNRRRLVRYVRCL
jgi:hypothetical protein